MLDEPVALVVENRQRDYHTQEGIRAHERTPFHTILVMILKRQTLSTRCGKYQYDSHAVEWWSRLYPNSLSTEVMVAIAWDPGPLQYPKMAQRDGPGESSRARRVNDKGRFRTIKVRLKGIEGGKIARDRIIMQVKQIVEKRCFR